MIIKTLTGRRRHRVQRIGLRGRQSVLALQIEEHHTGNVWGYFCGSLTQKEINEKVWRDATVTDLTLETSAERAIDTVKAD